MCMLDLALGFSGRLRGGLLLVDLDRGLVLVGCRIVKGFEVLRVLGECVGEYCWLLFSFFCAR